MARPNYYFRMLTALTLTAAAAVLAALLMASLPAWAQEEGSSFVGGTNPSDQQTGVPRDTNVTVYFSWDVYVDQSTVNTDTFTLIKQGSTTPVAASVTFYTNCQGENWSGLPCYAVLDPQQDLEANTTYTATLKGGENGVKGTSLYGDPITMPADYSWSFTTGGSTAPQAPADTTAPTISITSPAEGATYQQGASIYANYSCSDSVDSSPQCTGTVPNGSAIDTSTTGTKTFTVTAKDSAGNTNSKSVTYYVTKNGKARGNR